MDRGEVEAMNVCDVVENWPNKGCGDCVFNDLVCTYSSRVLMDLLLSGDMLLSRWLQGGYPNKWIDARSRGRPRPANRG